MPIYTDVNVPSETSLDSALWTLNQRVGGSSPPRLTIIFNDLRQAEGPAVFHL